VLREVDVKLRPLTVIVGPNGAGKSTLLEALQYFTTMPTFGAREARAFLSRLHQGPLEIVVSGSFSGKRLEHFTPDLGNVPISSGEGIWNGRPLRKGSRFPVDLGEAISPTEVYRFNIRRLSAPSVPRSVALKLPFDGEGLASLLAGLYLEDFARFQSLVERLKGVVPGVEGCHIGRSEVQDEEVIGHQLVFDMKGGKGIPASDISDGTLLTLALLTALMTVDRSQLILVDDLERGLHPKAVGDLIQQLRRIQAENPELQIVASSHSPYLVGFLQAEEVLLTSLDEDGYAAIKPLTDHPDYERWKDFMDPGEFWSTVGESWVTKRNASLTPR
jgi:predicted ATPase